MEGDLTNQKAVFKKKTEIATLQMQKKRAIKLDFDENMKMILEGHERSQSRCREVIDKL